MKHQWLGGFAAAILAAPALAQFSLDTHWDPGAEDCTPGSARRQAHAIDETTIAIRQNPCVDYEAPLLFLLIGAERALLIDSGASGEPGDTDALTQMVGSYLTRPDGSFVITHAPDEESCPAVCASACPQDM